MMLELFLWTKPAFQSIVAENFISYLMDDPSTKSYRISNNYLAEFVLLWIRIYFVPNTTDSYIEQFSRDLEDFCINYDFIENYDIDLEF